MKHVKGLVLVACLSTMCVERATEFHLNAGPLFNFARFKFGCLPKIQGYLAGLHADFELVTPCCFYTSIIFDGRWNAGFICGDQDTKAQIKDYRSQWFLGYRFCSGCNTSITPFWGFGFYHLSQELKPDIMSYRYFNIFIPLGLHFEWDPCSDEFTIGLSVLYRPDVWTRLKLDTPCVQACDNQKIKLKRSYGVHVALPMQWVLTCNECVDVQTKIVPFFDWNRFGKADEANCNGLCFEVPRLDRWYLGLHIDIGIRF